MTLTDEQKAKVAEWVEAGANLNEIQERLRSELDITITFLETRFLLADLDLEIQEPKAPEEPKKPEETEKPEPVAGEADVLPDAPVGGGVTVGVDQIARPGAAVSGKVTFSDGKKAAWYVTQYGELGLDPEDAEYRPNEADVLAFQNQLQRLLRQEGF